MLLLRLIIWNLLWLLSILSVLRISWLRLILKLKCLLISRLTKHHSLFLYLLPTLLWISKSSVLLLMSLRLLGLISEQFLMLVDVIFELWYWLSLILLLWWVWIHTCTLILLIVTTLIWYFLIFNLRKLTVLVLLKIKLFKQFMFN